MSRKPFSFKETRLYVALALMIQSFTFFIMFIILCTKKKSIAAAFLAVSAMSGGTSGYLLYQLREETRAGLDAAGEALSNDELDFDPANLAEEDGEPITPAPIPREENVSEEEFL